MNASISNKSFVGALDSVESGKARGWIANADEPDVPRKVELLIDSSVVAETLASNYRPDLETKDRSGRNGFVFWVPAKFYDGQPHQVMVRDKVSSTVLLASAKEFRSSFSTYKYPIFIGGNVSGEAQSTERRLADQERIAAGLLCDGLLVSSAAGEVRSIKGGFAISYRIPLPAEFCDGRPHHFQVVVLSMELLLGEAILVAPTRLIDEGAMHRIAGEHLTPSVSTISGYRYEALTSAFERCVALPDAKGAAAMKDVMSWHDSLVRGPDQVTATFPPLVSPDVDTPLISIVIPAHNKFPVTYHCLCSILLNGSEHPFEIVVVDDGSSDETKRLPELAPNIRYVRNEKAQGFIKACNKGAAAARGKFIVMLNNDTEVTPRWLEELAWPFDHFEKVGMVGAKLIYPDGVLQEAGGIVWGNGDPWNYGRRGNAYEPRYNYARQTDYLSGACLMLPTVLWRQIGGFSEDYLPAYFEDTDLAFQVRDRGFRTVYAPFSVVIHTEGVSNGLDVSSGTKRYQESNRPKFKSRWSQAFYKNGRYGQEVERNKDRNVELRALVLDAEPPKPDKDAGGYAAVQEMRMLQALGFKCTFAAENLAWLPHYTQQLQRMGVECVYSPYASSLASLIAERGEEFDLVYITRFYIARVVIDALRKHAPQAKVVMCNADLHFLRELRNALRSSDSALMLLAETTREKELEVMRKVDLVLSYTDAEMAVIESHNIGSTPIARCPWSTEVSTHVPSFAERDGIAFLGGFNHPPNAEAVDWFLANVFPKVLERLPNANFHVFGSRMTPQMRERWSQHPNVVIEGWVSDVSGVYDRCRVFVAPLQYGAGIKGKVIGALAHGMPSVLSPIAAEGIGIQDGAQALLAREPDQWAEAIVLLHQDQAIWSQVSAAAIGFAVRQYGFESAVSQMREALRKAQIFTPATSEALVAR